MYRLLLLCVLFTATLQAQAPVIHEVMARNASGLTDQDGDFSDWIEIYNPGAASIALGGFYLTDDDALLTKWQFPATTLPAGGYLVVFASRKDRAVSGRQLHTNFKIAGKGEYLALVGPNGSTVVSAFAPLPKQRTDFSYGVSGLNAVFFASPTPGAANASGVPAFVEPTTITARRGLHTSPATVGISTATPGAMIRYTLDGSRPKAGAGFAYSGSFTVSGTTVVRAAAFAPGLGPSEEDAATLVFVDDVVLQPDQPSGYPTSWGGAPAVDYGMDPEIVQSSAYRQDVKTGLQSLPILSVALPAAEMFGSGGLYSNTTRSGRAWEREVSVEYVDPSSGEEFRTRAGLRIQGGASRNPNSSPKHSMSLRFRDAYEGDLDSALFADKRVSQFASLQLRAGYNNSWIHWDSGQRSRGMMIRDQWVRDSLRAMGQADAGQGRYVHLFLNGLYWGVMNLHERMDASHYAEYRGGKSWEYDARNGATFTDGDSAAWGAMRSAVTGGNWPLIQARLDVDNYIDWQIVNRFAGNRDWKTSGNWRAAGGGIGQGPFRFYSWDAERTLESRTQNGTSPSSDPPDLLRYLDNIPEFVTRFGDRLHKHFFHGGALTDSPASARFQDRASKLDPAIVAESARWGDYRRDVHASRNGPYLLYTRDGHWKPETQRITSSYFPGRSARVLSQYRSLGFYPSVVAPTFSQHGGKVTSGYALTMFAPQGQVLFTTDGTDPRMPGGGVSPGAQTYSSAVTLLASTTVRARALSGGAWSALLEARFVIDAIAINEILAKNTTGIFDNVGEREDWIELFNGSSVTVDVGGMYLSDSVSNPTKWQIPSGQVIPAGGSVLIWADDQPSQGPMHATFKLSTGGEQLWLFDLDGTTLLDSYAFGAQVEDVSTGRLHDGEMRWVTFPVPSPGNPNSIGVCGSRAYSALDSTTQTMGLTLAGVPRLGQLVQFESRGGPASGSRVLIAGLLADELIFPTSVSRILTSAPLFVLGAVPASASGAADVPLQIPAFPALAGESVYFQTWAVNAGPWQGSVGLEVKFCQ